MTVLVRPRTPQMRPVRPAPSAKTTVLVIGGGQGAEHNASVSSAAEVAEALARTGHEVCSVTISQEGIWQVPDAVAGGTVAESLAFAMMLLGRTDIVFPVVRHAREEDGALAALCALAGVRVVGSSLRVGAISRDEWATKQIARAAGIRTARGLLVAEGSRSSLAFQGAALVRPVGAGTEQGVTLVREATGLGPALTEAGRFSSRVLVEEVVPGRDVTVAVMREAGGARWVAPPLQALDDGEDSALMHAALTMFDALGCAGVVEMSFTLTGDEPVLRRVDTLPCLSAGAPVPRMFEAAGVAHAELIARLVRAATVPVG